MKRIILLLLVLIPFIASSQYRKDVYVVPSLNAYPSGLPPNSVVYDLNTKSFYRVNNDYVTYTAIPESTLYSSKWINDEDTTKPIKNYVSIPNLLIDKQFYYGGGTGDVNGNGTVNSADALLIQYYIAGNPLITFTTEQLLNMDLDGDGRITMNDADICIGMALNKYPKGTVVGIDSLRRYMANITAGLNGLREFEVRGRMRIDTVEMGNTNYSFLIHGPSGGSYNRVYSVPYDSVFTWQYSLIQRHGFVDNSSITLSYSPTTHIVSMFNGAPGYYWNGKLYRISGPAKTYDLDTIPTGFADGETYYVYLDDGTAKLYASETPWTLQDNKVPVCYVLWNSTLYPKYWLAIETHQSLIDRRMHLYLHNTSGAKWVSGGLTGDYVVGGSTNDDNTISISSAVIYDEDIIHNLAALTDPTGATGEGAYVTFYHSGANTWAWDTTDMPYKWTSGSYIEYDNGTGVVTGANNKYYNTYLLFTNFNGAGRYIIVPGRGEFSLAADAYLESPANFDWTGFPIKEAVIAYQMTWKSNAGKTVKGKVELVRDPVRINSTVTTITTPSIAESDPIFKAHVGDSIRALQRWNISDAVGTGIRNERVAYNETIKFEGSGITTTQYDSTTHTMTISSPLTTGNLTESVTGLQFSNTRQVIGGATALSLTSGYIIPTTTQSSNWDSHLTNDLDLSASNELQSLSYTQATGAMGISGGTGATIGVYDSYIRGLVPDGPTTPSSNMFLNVSGDWSVPNFAQVSDTSKFNVDNINNYLYPKNLAYKLGIGTATPLYKLHSVGSADIGSENISFNIDPVNQTYSLSIDTSGSYLGFWGEKDDINGWVRSYFQAGIDGGSVAQMALISGSVQTLAQISAQTTGHISYLQALDTAINITSTDPSTSSSFRMNPTFIKLSTGNLFVDSLRLLNSGVLMSYDSATNQVGYIPVDSLVVSSGDNLGDHEATQALDMNEYDITGVGTFTETDGDVFLHHYNNNLGLGVGAVTRLNGLSFAGGTIYNTGVGTACMNNLSITLSAVENSGLGHFTLNDLTGGDYNAAFGARAMNSTTTGSQNTVMGYMGLYQNLTGSGNVALGHKAGYYETLSNKLYIENSPSDSTDALIFGDFIIEKLRLNSTLSVRDVPTISGASHIVTIDSITGDIRKELASHFIGVPDTLDYTASLYGYTDHAIITTNNGEGCTIPNFGAVDIVYGGLVPGNDNLGSTYFLRADGEWGVPSGITEVVDEAYNSTNFDGGTTSGVSQDDFYDYNHLSDTTDDGYVDKVKDLQFNSYKAVAMACDNGITMPSAPAEGQWFLQVTTGRKILFQYSNSTWNPIAGYGDITYYVDKTDGTDNLNNGTGADGSAFKTLQYAINAVPTINSGNVTIQLNAESYAEVISIGGKNFTGTNQLTIQGVSLDDITPDISAAKDAFTRGQGGSTPSTEPQPARLTDVGAFVAAAQEGKWIEYDGSGTHRLIYKNTTDTLYISEFSATSVTNYKIRSLSTVITNSSNNPVISIAPNQVAVEFKYIKLTNTGTGKIYDGKPNSNVSFTYCYIDINNGTNINFLDRASVNYQYSYLFQDGSNSNCISARAGSYINTTGVVFRTKNSSAQGIRCLGSFIQTGSLVIFYGNPSTTGISLNNFAGMTIFQVYMDNYTTGIVCDVSSYYGTQSEAYLGTVNVTTDIYKPLIFRNAQLSLTKSDNVSTATIGYDGTGDYNYFNAGSSTSNVDLVIDNTQKVGVNTSAPDKQLEINSSTGDNLRLTYNDTDGSATTKVDFTVSSGGNLTIASTGDVTVSPTGEDVILDAERTGIYQASPESRLDVNGSVSVPITKINTTTTLDITHHTVLVDNGAETGLGRISVRFPAAASCDGRVYILKLMDEGDGGNGFTMDPDGSELIYLTDGLSATTYNFDTEGGSVTLQSYNGAWVVIDWSGAPTGW